MKQCLGVIKHIRRWNYWRKNNSNGRFYKILVLFGMVKSPTMVIVLLPEEIETRKELERSEGE